MAATALRTAILLLACGVLALADQPEEVLRAVNRVTTGLAGNDAKAALDAFDHSFADYAKLSSYFENLTASYDITNEADIVSEEDSAAETKLTLDWSLTLKSQASDDTLQRRRQVQMVLQRKNRGWTIVSFSPIDLFDPQNASPK